jgi:hypothetical protein
MPDYFMRWVTGVLQEAWNTSLEMAGPGEDTRRSASGVVGFGSRSTGFPNVFADVLWLARGSTSTPNAPINPFVVLLEQRFQPLELGFAAGGSPPGGITAFLQVITGMVEVHNFDARLILVPEALA